MFVSASSECFPDLSLDGVLHRLHDLEYTNLEIAIHENGGQLKPSAVLADLDKTIATCRETYRLTISAYSVDITAEGEEYYDQFAACCKLAKATKVVTLTVPSAELGTPFNEEVERLRKLVTIASREGVLVGVRSQMGRLSQDPDTVMVFCNNVPGLGVTLDPSHYICGPAQGKRWEQLLKYTTHVHLRDTTKSQLEVRIGQGEIEYGRLIGQLRKLHYNRALCVNIGNIPNADQMAEMRKLRLLLESLL